MIIVLEGLDASGKNTQAQRLAEHFNGTVYSFPRYEGPVGPAIRRHLHGTHALMTKDGSDYRRSDDDAIALQSLFFLDRFLIANEIEERSVFGETIILDRWWQSSATYGVDDGLKLDDMLTVGGMLPSALVNILIDIPVEVMKARRPVARDRYERDEEKLKRIRHRYIDLWSLYDDNLSFGYWRAVDGTKDVEEVYKSILDAVDLARGMLGLRKR